MIFLPTFVKAETYITTENLFENSYTNNLIDMAQTQIKNISNKKYAIIQINYDYYLISAEAKDVTSNKNVITLNNTSIISCIRTQNGYNYYYDYAFREESSTTIYANNIIVSNIDTTKSVSSQRFDNYKQNNYVVWLLTFILGLIFAIFLTKERSY